MKIEIAFWGINLQIGGVKLHIFLGDIYFRLPRCFEVAWNSSGFYFDRLYQARGKY